MATKVTTSSTELLVLKACVQTGRRKIMANTQGSSSTATATTITIVAQFIHPPLMQNASGHSVGTGFCSKTLDPVQGGGL